MSGDDLAAARDRVAADPDMQAPGVRFVPAGDPDMRPGDVAVFAPGPVDDPRPESPERVTARMFAEAREYVATMPAPEPVGREPLARLGRPLPVFYQPPVKQGRRARLLDLAVSIRTK